MSIPIKNIYYLLCYAWDQLESAGMMDLDHVDSPGVLDLLASVLITGTHALLKHGLDRSYVTIEDEVPGIRGKLLLGASLKTGRLQQSRAVCECDELSFDVLQNQILASTLDRLLLAPTLDTRVRDDLVDIRRRLPRLSRIDLSSRHFIGVRVHRNNRIYRMLIDLCRLVHESLIPSEDEGKYRFLDFQKDEPRMNRLFEQFLREFYRREQTAFPVVKRERLPWDPVEGDSEHLRLLPWMETDVSLIGAERHLVIDAKYYKTPLATGQFGRSALRPDHVRQIYAYLQNLAHSEAGRRRPEGILLYAGVGEAFDLRYKIHGLPIRAVSVDLSKPWPRIHDQLLSFLE